MKKERGQKILEENSNSTVLKRNGLYIDNIISYRLWYYEFL